MFKRIYTILFTGTLLSMQPIFATPQKSTNIKKIIQKKDKIIVIIHENGKDRELTLTKEALDILLNRSKKSAQTQKKPLSPNDTAKKESIKKEKKVTQKSVKNRLKTEKIVKKTSKKDKKKKVASTKSNKKQLSSQNKKSQKLRQYTVKKGDTLFSIALKYKVSLTNLTQINNINSNTIIHPGDTLKIPSTNFIESAKKEVANNKKSVYRVKAGDTLYSIAKKYNMKIETLKKLNNLKPHPKLKAGMELTVIGKPIELKKRKIPTKHIVKRGETIWMIARKYNLTIQQLRLLNPKIRTHSLRVGAVLNVSKKAAIKLAKSKKYKRRSRLSGVLARYKRRSRGSARDVVAYAKRFLGSRYVWGASRPGAFDCSGFTQYVMRHAKGRSIPRVSRRQAYYGRYVSRRNLRAGDLVFFDTSRRRRGYVNHVGIYIGNGKFIHASSGKHRVVITSLNKPFYRQRFMWGRRIN